MANAVFPAPFQSGFRLINGDDLNNALSTDLVSSQNGITAHSGGGQANAFQITTGMARFSTVAANGDSAKLPTALAGRSVTIDNDGVFTLAIFPSGTDTLEDVTTSILLPPGADTTFVCPIGGKWYELGSTFNGVLIDAINQDWVQGTTQLNSVSTTTLAPIVGLQVNLTTSGTYAVQASLPVSTNSTAGIKVAAVASGALTAISSNLTASFLTASTVAVVQSTVLGSGLGSTATVILAQLSGTLVVNTGGPVTLQAAQNVSTTGTASILAGSWLAVTRMS